MNIIILTPDRVGSTLLQRLITVAMHAHDYGKPVINLHELTNGIEKYHSSVFNQEVLGKPNNRPWGYYQKLEDIVDLLESTDHYKTSRLAQYHLKNRQDPVESQLPFYQYINDNFYIISCRRNNLFEHALSWIIFTQSKKLNVYNHQDKIDTFKDIYQKKIFVDLISLEKYLKQYQDYIQWVDNHFSVNRYFVYDKDLFNIENFIDNLPIFPKDTPHFWTQNFGISWNDWNKCHHLVSDMSGLANQLQLENTQNFQLNNLSLEYNSSRSSTELTTVNYKLNANTQLAEFFNNNKVQYLSTYKKIKQLETDRILVTGMPIKLQTLAEKCLLIKNLDEVIVGYNRWVSKNNFGEPVDIEHLQQQMISELEKYYTISSA
jgi:hypothetical protein